MKMKKFVALAMCGLAAVSAFAAGKKKAKEYKIYLITMDQMDHYWKNIDTGCQKAVKEIGGVKYQWLAPDVKDDQKQIECINNAVAAGADAILLAANGPNAVTAALKDAASQGVKIIYVDSPAAFTAVQTLSTDNKAAGKTAGETMLKGLKAKGITGGSIGIVSVNTATTSTVQREAGFREAFAGTPYTLLTTQYCDGDTARSKDAGSNFITQGCVGLYGCNEGSANGIGSAIAEAGKTVIGVGFDTSDMVKSHIRNGNLIATMAQNPDTMGYEGIKSAVKSLSGGKISPAVVDTGVTVVTKDNVSQF